MKPIRSLLCLATASFALALPLPSTAKPPQKSYNLEFLLPATDALLMGRTNPAYDPVTGQLLAPVAVTVTVRNESPPSTANSNISSFQLTVSGLALLGDPANVSCAGALCSVDPNTNTVYVTNISPPIQAKGKFTVTFHASSCVVLGEAFIEKATVYTGQLTGDTFFPFAQSDASFPMVLTLSTRSDATDPPTIADTGISCGALACGQAFSVAESRTSCAAGPADPICVTTGRGTDKNGACPSTVSYFVTNLLEAKRKLHFKWDTDSSAAFAYRVNVMASAEPAWQAGWLPTDGEPIFIGAPACFGADFSTFPSTSTSLPLPAQLATLTSAIKANDKQIKVSGVSPSLPTVLPFPIVIGSERMSVTKVNATGWAVDRGQALTQATPHPINAPVMSTPLQTLTSAEFSTDPALLAIQQSVYTVGQQAQICRASKSNDNGDGTWSAWFIDIGDGWVTIR